MARRATPPMPIAAFRSQYSYDPATGIFVRLINKRKWKAGQIVGTVCEHGYVRISINRERFYAQDLAWFHVTGNWPSGPVDHKNRNPSDNRWKNLRKATYSQNIFNGRRRKNNTSGIPGVVFDTKNNTWCAMIVVNRRRHWLGRFPTKEAAQAAREAAAREFFADFANKAGA